MIRLDAALVCDAFWGAILLAGSLDGFKPSREKMRARGNVWLALAGVLAVSFGLNEYNKHAHRNVLEGCDVAAWNQARALLSDTCPIRPGGRLPVRGVRRIRQRYQDGPGVHQLRYGRFQHGLSGKASAGAGRGRSSGPGAWVRGEKALHLFPGIPSWTFCRAGFYSVWPAACLFPAGFPGSGVLRGHALLVLILLYMSSIDRLYFRVVYPTFLIAGLCLLL